MDGWLKKRVVERLTALDLGPVEAATAIGIERTFIRDIVEGKKASVRPDGAQKLEKALDAPKDWFLFEEFEWTPGARTLKKAPKKPGALAHASQSSAQDDGTVPIPEYDVRVAAGGGALIEGSDIRATWGFSSDYVTRELRANASALNMVEVIGDSMEPKLSPGDRIIVNQNDVNPTPPGVFALWDGYGLVVKNVQRVHRSEPEKLLLISENPIYPPYEVLIDEIKIIGRVISCLKKM